MLSFRRAVLLGFVIWLVPFATGVSAFLLSPSPLLTFASDTGAVLVLSVLGAAAAYFRRVRQAFFREGLALGVVWVAMCVAIDVPLLLGPMHMSLEYYFSDVGVSYLVIPAITLGIGALLDMRAFRMRQAGAPPPVAAGR